MNNTQKTILMYLPLTLLILVIAGGAFLFYQYQQAQANLKTQQAQPQTPLEAMARLMELPQGEDPVLQTVEKKEDINKNPLFAKVENGDIIAIYPKKSQAIVYRPSTNKIIAVGAVQLNQPSGTPPQR